MQRYSLWPTHRSYIHIAIAAFSVVGFACLCSEQVKTLQDHQIEVSRRAQYLQELCEAPEPNYTGFGGPWTESLFKQHFHNLNQTLRCVYIGIQWNDCLCSWSSNMERAWSEMQAFLNDLDRSICYFTVSMNSGGFKALDIPLDLRLVVFDSGGGVAQKYKYEYDNKMTIIPIPHLKKELTPRNITKKVLGTFIGHLETEISHNGTVRPRLAALLHNVIHFHPSRGDGWEDIMSEGYFSLCPRGHGATSYRLYEAIQLEVLPVYVWDRVMWLPFQELLDWSQFAIVVEAPFMHTIENRLRDASIERLTHRLRQVRHMFTNHFVCQYIADTMTHIDLS